MKPRLAVITLIIIICWWTPVFSENFRSLWYFLIFAKCCMTQGPALLLFLTPSFICLQISLKRVEWKQNTTHAEEQQQNLILCCWSLNDFWVAGTKTLHISLKYWRSGFITKHCFKKDICYFYQNIRNISLWKLHILRLCTAASETKSKWQIQASETVVFPPR